MNVPDDEYKQIVSEARAWRSYVMSRLEYGQVPSNVTITCISGSGTFQISDPVVVTPFGKMNVTFNEKGIHTVSMILGDSYQLSHIVQLRIN